MRHALSALAVLVVVAHVTVGAQPPSPGAPPSASDAAHHAQLVARAERAIAELQATLLARLKAELSAGGPPAAVTVCRDEAQQLTAGIGATHQLMIGRTSDRVRNPANTPRPWASPHVTASAGSRAADARGIEVQLEGGGLGVLRPIGTADFCVLCHGQRAAVQAAIGPVLSQAYPNDRAVGFSPGDLRGWFWVEVR